jgi:LysM repeat protein
MYHDNQQRPRDASGERARPRVITRMDATGEIVVITQADLRRAQQRLRASTRRRPSAGQADAGRDELGRPRSFKQRSSSPRSFGMRSSSPRSLGMRSSSPRSLGMRSFGGRLATLAGIIALAVPVALAVRGGDARSESLAPAETRPDAVPATIAPTPSDATTSAATTSPATTAPPTAAPTVTTAAPVTTQAAAPATTAARRRLACASKYTVVRGDSWSRIAGKVDVATGDMLAANDATARTLLLPGQVICLPPGATPTTTAPPATAPPTTKPRVTTTTVKTTPPPVTSPPVTSPTRTYTKDEIVQIIREEWPDHLEEKALTIVQRESRFNPLAKNSCCYGLFQINWNAHKSWLVTIGVTSATQLLDPRVNAHAAYIVYQRSGSFAPWGG